MPQQLTSVQDPKESLQKVKDVLSKQTIHINNTLRSFSLQEHLTQELPGICIQGDHAAAQEVKPDMLSWLPGLKKDLQKLINSLSLLEHVNIDKTNINIIIDTLSEFITSVKEKHMPSILIEERNAARNAAIQEMQTYMLSCFTMVLNDWQKMIDKLNLLDQFSIEETNIIVDSLYEFAISKSNMVMEEIGIKQLDLLWKRIKISYEVIANILKPNLSPAYFKLFKIIFPELDLAKAIIPNQIIKKFDYRTMRSLNNQAGINKVIKFSSKFPARLLELQEKMQQFLTGVNEEHDELIKQFIAKCDSLYNDSYHVLIDFFSFLLIDENEDITSYEDDDKVVTLVDRYITNFDTLHDYRIEKIHALYNLATKSFEIEREFDKHIQEITTSNITEEMLIDQVATNGATSAIDENLELTVEELSRRMLQNFIERHMLEEESVSTCSECDSVEIMVDEVSNESQDSYLSQIKQKFPTLGKKYQNFMAAVLSGQKIVYGDLNTLANLPGVIPTKGDGSARKLFFTKTSTSISAHTQHGNHRHIQNDDELGPDAQARIFAGITAIVSSRPSP